MPRILKAFFFMYLSLTACVSVELPTEEAVAVRSKNVSYKDPRLPYEKMKISNLDAAWKNRENGNTISFLSQCNDPDDSSLTSVRSEVLSKLHESKIMSSKYIDLSQRKALYTHIYSLVDGYPTEMELVVLKKNDCLYIINYVASQKEFLKDQELFQLFLNGFKAQ